MTLADDLRAAAASLANDTDRRSHREPVDFTPVAKQCARIQILADAIEQYYKAHTADQPSGDDTVFSYMRLHALIKGDPTT